MRNNVLIFILIALISSARLVHAETGTEQTIEEAIRHEFATLKIDTVRKTEIDGLYEISFDGKIVYFHPKTGLTLVGEILNKDGVSLTAQKKAEVSAARIRALPLEKAIKIGNGKNTIIEMVDPDCPFCRKTAAFFKKRKDVTQYIFLFPIKELHPEAERHAQYILCAKDRTAAYDEALSGQLDDEEIKLCDDDKTEALLAEHQQIGQKLGVRGTPSLWINGEFVSGADIKKIVQILEPHS